MKKVRVLLVEDVLDDAELIVLELSRQGFDVDWVRVFTVETMISHLQDRQYDVIISDFMLPGFTG